jgi:hypothetical protein
MSAEMSRPYFRNEFSDIAEAAGAKREIHVFEPYRIKQLVKASELFENVAPDHEEGAGGLFDRTADVQVAIEITITAVHWIARPQAV